MGCRPPTTVPLCRGVDREAASESKMSRSACKAFVPLCVGSRPRRSCMAKLSNNHSVWEEGSSTCKGRDEISDRSSSDVVSPVDRFRFLPARNLQHLEDAPGKTDAGPFCVPLIRFQLELQLTDLGLDCAFSFRVVPAESRTRKAVHRTIAFRHLMSSSSPDNVRWSARICRE